MHRTFAALAFLALAASAAFAQQGPAPWRDRSPHRVRMVAVAPGVRLETLDWGGRGRTLVLLSGLGDVGHVYDSIAPTFTGSFHVVAITRRGFGASSQPTASDVGTLASDIAAVLDSLRIRRAVFIGHSLAGDELVALAARRPDLCEGMVFLDAAYDRSALGAVWEDVLATLPKMTAADSASYAGYEGWMFRQMGVHIPEAQIRAMEVFDARGRFVRDVTPDSQTYSIIPHLPAPDFSRLPCPSLAIYAVPDTSAQARQRAARDSAAAAAGPPPDSATLARAQRIAAAIGDMGRRSRLRFREQAPNAEVLEIPGANHYVFLSNRAETLAAIRAFLARTAPAPDR